MNSPPQKTWHVGIAPRQAPKEFMEYKTVLAESLQEAIDKTVESVPDFLRTHEIREVSLRDVVDIA